MDPVNLPHGEKKRKDVQNMFDAIAPRYDLVNRIMTFRLDTRWRKKTITSLQLKPGATVLDLACGTGDFVVALAKGGHTPVGIDLSFGMLSAAQSDDTYVQGDLLALPIGNSSVDGAVCGFALRNLVSLEPFFAELFRVCKPGSRIALLDVSRPDNKYVRSAHSLYFNTIVPKVGGLLSDRKAYAYLPKSFSYLPEPEEMLALLTKIGFADAARQQLTFGAAQLLTAQKPA